MAWLILGITGVIVVLLGLRWFVNAEPRQIMAALRWVGLALAVAIAVLVIVSGRFQLLLTALFFLLPWLSRMRVLRNRQRAARGPSPGQTSEVRTRFVIMHLAHDTGEMDGSVLEGPYAGRRLSEMELYEVLGLYRTAVGADTPSAKVLEAYLDRMHGGDWREGTDAGAQGTDQTGSAGRAASGVMTVEEARAILGVGADATSEDIKQAHRRIMLKVHPDHGGSDYLAARVNQAKELLLGSSRSR